MEEVYPDSIEVKETIYDEYMKLLEELRILKQAEKAWTLHLEKIEILY